MNKRFKSILVIIGIIMLATSCTDHFNNMNTDPNKPTPDATDPKFEFIYAQSRSMLYSSQWQVGDQMTVDHFCEFAANDPLSSSDYSIDSRYIQGIWDLTYVSLSNFNSIIRNQESNPRNVNVVQMSKIWKVWLMLRLTDYLGDIPYSQAANAEATNPKYDTQKDIYYKMFEELTDATSKLTTSEGNIGTYDLAFSGDIIKWKKFANSLRLRMALRIADVDNAKAKTEAAAAIAGGVMTSASDAAQVRMGDASSETASQSPLYYHRNQSVIHMSTAYYKLVNNFGGIAWPTIADQKTNTNITKAIVEAKIHPTKVDPRAIFHFEPSGVTEKVATQSLFGNWAGTEPGNVSSAVGASMITGQKQADYAKIGEFYYKSPNRPYPVLKYSEVCFLQAIAIVKGIISTGDAKALYEAGVRDNMAEFGISATIVDKYLSSSDKNTYGTSPKYDDNIGTCNTALDKILTQKWLSHFVEGSFEAWADHRQYHKPTLMPFEHVNESSFTMSSSDKTNNTPNAYIKRGYYPSSEVSVNKANLEEAIARMGSNSIQNNVWWDVK
ncbi:MAG: SusD/RagB family nutrient-binding outer membrane lipoprotein [Bacteroidales bacterium]